MSLQPTHIVRTSKFLSASLFIVLFSGCVSPLHRIPYIFDIKPEDEPRFAAVQNMYMVVRQPEVGAFSSSQQWASTLQRSISPLGGHILAARKIPTQEPIEQDRFIKKLEPSLVVETAFSGFRLNTWTTQKEVIIGATKETQHKEIQTTWHFSGLLSATLRTYVYPDLKKIIDQNFIVTTTEHTKTTGAPSEYDTSAAIQESLGKLAQLIAPILSPAQPVYRDRKLFVDDQDKNSSQALSLAAKGQWSKAIDIWTNRLQTGKGQWKDLWNIAVAAEVNRQKEDAQKKYQLARSSAAESAEAAQLPWDQIQTDLATYRSPIPPSLKAREWFSSQVAIVPFEENTVSIDGPEFIRKTIQKKLKNGGYPALDVDQGDEQFQNLGLSDGGQLPAFKRSDLSKKMKSPWLVFGDIEAFNETNVGIYRKHEIKGSIHIWDARLNDDVYACDKEVKTQSIPDSGAAILTNFISGLAETWIEHAAKQPMALQVNSFVETCLDEFPLQP